MRIFSSYASQEFYYGVHINVVRGVDHKYSGAIVSKCQEVCYIRDKQFMHFKK